MRTKAASSKAKQSGGTITATTTDLVEEAKNPTTDADRACSNRGS